jgi:CheY-like chemotaxis protein
MNLCVNARDAMAEGGTLDIAVENILLDGQSPDRPPDIHAGPYVRLTVTDSGTGIAPETLERIFEPFFTTKPQGQGTGLGLPTVLNIVKAHGGFIQTQSQPGCGTSFRVFLPAAETSSKAASPEPAPLPPQGRGEQILVIDDERAFQEITKAIFEKHGYRVLTASDGAEALAVFAQHKGAIDLVMTDMVMPFLDGPATIKALRSIDPQVRILAASGLSESERLTGELTNTAFLLKPFTSERLLTTVHEVLHPGGRKAP